MTPLPPSFYQREDVVRIARDLLGKLLITNIEGKITSGYITETEAYRGPEDKASHAYQMRRTPRNESMYAQGGVSYVFVCYGMHQMFNIVTNVREVPHAVLVRAIEPIKGLEVMITRRGCADLRQLTNGPGKLTQALGITRMYDGLSLASENLSVLESGRIIDPDQVIAGPRVGIDYAEEDRFLPWRFRLTKTAKAEIIH